MDSSDGRMPSSNSIAVRWNIGPSQFALEGGMGNACMSLALAFTVCMVNVAISPSSQIEWNVIGQGVRVLAMNCHDNVRKGGALSRYGMPTSEDVRDAMIKVQSSLAQQTNMYLYVDDIAAAAVSNGRLDLMAHAAAHRTRVRKEYTGSLLLESLHGASHIKDHIRAAVQIATMPCQFGALGACGLVLTKNGASHAAAVHCQCNAVSNRWAIAFYLFDSHGRLSDTGSTAVLEISVEVQPINKTLVQPYSASLNWEVRDRQFYGAFDDFSDRILKLLGYADPTTGSSQQSYNAYDELGVANHYHVVNYVVPKSNVDGCLLLQNIVEDDHVHNKLCK
jgi:hypothetical protein